MSDPFIGEIRLLSFGRVPTGWLGCNGQLLSIAQYPVLFTLIGTTYGGDGSTTFGLPDLRGRVPIAAGTGPGQPPYVIGQMAGEEMHTLNSNELAAHSHGMVSTTNAGTTVTPGTSVHIAAAANAKKIYNSPTNAPPYATMAPCVMPAGNNQPHDNSMPSVCCNYCICNEGIYPTPG